MAGVGLRELAKAGARAAATVLVAPELLSFAIRARLMGRDRALEGSSQLLSLVPGVVGQYLRRAFLARALEGCAPTATIAFGALFSKAGARVDADAYVGAHCHIGLAHIGRGVLLASGVQVPSGAHTHGTTDAATLIRDQEGERRVVRIGDGTWVGAGTVVMADVGRDAVVGAGAVVTKPLPDRVVAAGVPARVVRARGAGAPGDDEAARVRS